MSDRKKLRDPLAEYVRTTGKSDAAIGRMIHVNRWRISRGRRGDPPLPLKDQIALEEYTGVTPAQWAEYYAKLLTQGSGAQKKSPRLSVAAEPEPAQ